MEIKTAEDVIKEMMSDKSAYLDLVEDMALKTLERDKKLLQSWIDWFNGSDIRPWE